MMRASRGGRLLGASVLVLGFGFLYLPIPAVDGVFVQRLASGDGMGRILDQVVRPIAARPAIARRSLGQPEGGVLDGLRIDGAGHDGRHGNGAHAAFPGKTLFGALITAPLVMPEVIIGLSILLLLVSMGGVLGTAPRGAVAIWMAHVTFTVLFVTVVISSRLQELDRSLEEAAMDLGATPLKVFF